MKKPQLTDETLVNLAEIYQQQSDGETLSGFMGWLRHIKGFSASEYRMTTAYKQAKIGR